VFGNRVLKKILGTERQSGQKAGVYCITRRSLICALSQIIYTVKEDVMGETCMEKRKNSYKILVGKPEDHLENLDADEKIILIWLLKK
jgi:hypothetical protein